jgi:hypothetical protein
MAAAGYDYYSPSSFRTVADSLRDVGQLVSSAADFTREVVDVGFPYPPMTMLGFALCWLMLAAIAMRAIRQPATEAETRLTAPPSATVA